MTCPASSVESNLKFPISSFKCPHTLTWSHGEVPDWYPSGWSEGIVIRCPSGCDRLMRPHPRLTTEYAGRIAPYCCGSGMRKAKETCWESRRRRHGLTILSKNLMSLRMMESAVSYSLCVESAYGLPYTPIDNRHLYHGSLNWPPYDTLPQ
jgi:hypothetical protein